MWITLVCAGAASTNHCTTWLDRIVTVGFLWLAVTSSVSLYGFGYCPLDSDSSAAGPQITHPIRRPRVGAIF
jgi:hypothetical protein